MTPEALAALHALCFSDAPKPWSAEAFAALTRAPTTILVTEPDGVALGRVAGPEAELLTLAVHPGLRRHGVGRRLVAAFETAAAARGATEAFLEVAATNAAAQALYASLGYAEAGRRPGYYARAGAPPIDAIVLSKPLDGGSRESD